jgi:hypothetical protein
MLERRAPCAANLELLLVPWLRLVICCAISLFWGPPALAHTVVLLRPPAHSSSSTELLQRLRGELLSVGFEVVVRDRPMGPEPSASGSASWQLLLADEQELEAAVDLVGDGTPVAVDVWIIDGEKQFQLVARVNLDANTENASKGLAIRASEVLRARLFESRVGPAEQPSPDTAPSPGTRAFEASAEKTEQARRLGFEVGVAALASLDGVGLALLPIVRFDWAIEPEFVLQATLAGFGTRPNVTTSAGNAQVAMQYALLGACYRLDWKHRVRPLGALSLGALRTAVLGQADLPREGHSVDQWSFLLDASLGAAFQLSRQFTVVLAGHAQLAQPYVAVRFGDQKVASAGRPNLLLTLTFGVWP